MLREWITKQLSATKREYFQTETLKLEAAVFFSQGESHVLRIKRRGKKLFQRWGADTDWKVMNILQVKRAKLRFVGHSADFRAYQKVITHRAWPKQTMCLIVYRQSAPRSPLSLLAPAWCLHWSNHSDSMKKHKWPFWNERIAAVEVQPLKSQA